MATLGLAVAAYAAGHYDIGSLRRMGPGFFPVALGVLLAVLGLLITLPALRLHPKTEPQPFAWREALGVIAALLLFGLLLNRLGLLATTALSVLIASAVAPRKGLGWRLVLAVAVSALTWVLFIRGLNMTIPVWPVWSN